MSYMCYEERLRRYEQDKAKLKLQPLTDKEYQKETIKLVNKWKI